MTGHGIYRFGLAIITGIFIITSTGCANTPNITDDVLPSATAAPAASEAPSAATAEATPKEAPVSDTGVLLKDDFTDPSTNWPEDKFDNYFIGYHEPEYYHIELSGPNYKTTVFEPQKRTFDDATVEVQAFTASKKTSPTGDYRFGIAFRRSGDQYYAFTVSPRTKKWFVLKNSPNKLEVLSEGTEESLHDADTDDDLRVDIQGSSFIFHINGNFIGEVSDPDYASGEVGFYVESFDSPNTHIHFDQLSIRTVQVSVVCDVSALSLNVRTGPGKSNPSAAILKSGETIEPVGRSEDNQWFKVKFNGGKDQGWVFNSTQYLTCRPSIDLLPVINP